MLFLVIVIRLKLIVSYLMKEMNNIFFFKYLVITVGSSSENIGIAGGKVEKAM